MGVRAAVGAHRDLSAGPSVAHSTHRFTQEVGGAASGVRPPLAQPGHQHVCGSGSDSRQLVIAALAGMAVKTWPQRNLRRKAPKVESALTVPPRVQARPSGAQRMGVVDAVSASQRGSDQGHHLVAGVGPVWGVTKLQALLHVLGKSEAVGQGGRKEHPGLGHQAVVVERDSDAVGVVAWQHQLGAPCSGVGLQLQDHCPRFKGESFWLLQQASHTPSFGGFGLSNWRVLR